MSHKNSAGSTSLGRDSNSQRLGVKLSDGQWAKPGSIIIRQRGTRYHLGKNVMLGKDHTIYSKILGLVRFTSKKMRKFDDTFKVVKVVSVFPKLAATTK